MHKQDLHQGWTVRAVGDLSQVPAPLRGAIIDAKVPGCVHTDLLRAGKIPDPYRDLNEFQTRWIGHTDWVYRTTFDADPMLFNHERIDLACDGLDTVATITLNGQRVATTQNMHRSFRFDVRPALKRVQNELVITFTSPVKYAEAMHAKNPRPYVNGPAGPFNAIRKMACNFGWDWGPALPTCGIWRGIRLEGWSTARIAAVLPQVVRSDAEVSTVNIVVHVETTSPGSQLGVEATLNDADHLHQRATWRKLEQNQASCILQIHYPRAERWWPTGYGNQPLYDLEVYVHDAARFQDVDAKGYDWRWAFDNHRCRIGLRTLELDTSPDEIGRKFVLKVNGKPIFCKGFNWIPDDCFLDRACEPSRVRQRIQQAVDTGGNMLRVWGGGIFETDDFYNICDEMGVLVWQDFLFACAMYAEEPLWNEVEAEARDNVSRLAHHPSLAIWNGCNENIWAYRDWGWKDHDDVKGPADGMRKSWGKGFYFELLPRICKELTPGIPYWAGSPWSGDYDVDNGVPPNAATHGNKHVWEAWFKQDYLVYRTFEPRFCSEFGFQGPATFSSIAAVVPPDKRDFGSLEMRHRQKSGNPVQDDGDRRNLRHLIHHFNLPGAQELLDALPLLENNPPPACGAAPVLPSRFLPSNVNFDDLHYLLGVNQCRALTLGVEWFRSRQPTCMGTLYWQLNDCWPGGTTWSCIDGDGKRKPLWYATRKFFADWLLTIQPEADGSLHLCAVNDTDVARPMTCHVARHAFDGTKLAELTIEIAVAPRSIVRSKLAAAVATAENPSAELIVAREARSAPKATWFFAVDRELRYPKSAFDAELHRAGDVHELVVHAQTLMRDVCVFADRIDPDAIVGEQLVTLLPGESFPFVVHAKRALSKSELMSPTVLRCVNPFGQKPL